MEQRNFQRLLRRTVAVPVILLILLAAALVVEILSLTSSLRMVDHTDQVIANARQVMRYMVDMESSVRGYELTHDKSFLEPFERAEAQLPASIDALVQLTGDNSLEQSRLKDIRQLDQNWVKWAKNEIAKTADKEPTEAELQQGNVLMDEIRARQREVVAEEERLLRLRTRRATILSRVALFTAVGLSLLVAALLLTLTRRELRRLSETYEMHLRAEADKTQQLKESRERFRTTLNSLGEAVVAADAEGRVTYINPVAQQLTGWDDYMAARGLPLPEVLRIVDEPTRAELTSPVELVRRAQMTVGLANHVALVSRSGREFPVEMNAAPIHGNKGEQLGTVVVFRDITQRLQTEETLRASERLTQAGRLSATIAHEIRNPLDTVSNLVYLLQHESGPSHDARQYLDLAGEELARITQITGQLLTFHREAQSPVEVRMTDLLESVLTLFGPQVRKAGVRVERRFETGRTVRGFPGELRQVFSNLVGNALDSMPNGGELVLHVRESRLFSDPERRGIRVTVADSGNGIPLGVRKNLFAPFYTTKGEKGTGLGLWVSRGIIEKHEGTIRFYSSVRAGQSGTAFSVFLPFEQVLGKLDSPKTQDHSIA